MPAFHWNDTKQFIRTIRFSKVWNALQVVGSYVISKLLKRPIQPGLPLAISIEPTTSCNLRCPECPSGLRSFTRPTGMLNEAIFLKTIDELQHSLFYLTFYFQGEPYLHPNFLEMVSYANQKGIYTATSTNAHFFTDSIAKQTVESGLKRLIISIDGTTQDTYQSYRIGGSLEKVLEGTRKVIEWKNKLKSTTPHIVFQFLVVKPNEHQIEDVYALAKEVGVRDVRLKTAQIYDYENGSELIPSIDKYARYRKTKLGKYEIKNKLLNHCWKMWHSCVITWDGKVIPCCFDKDAHYVLGEMKNHSFEEIWKSNSYTHFRKQLLYHRSQIEMCKNCTEGMPIWG